MALLQPNPTTATTQYQAEPKRRFRVVMRDAWGDPWVPAPYLSPTIFGDGTAPSVGEAKLKVLYGEIRRADATAFVTELPRRLRGKFIRIDAIGNTNLNPSSTGGEVYGSAPIWYGWIPLQEYHVHKGDAAAGVAQGDIVATAYELSHLLDTITITATRVRTGSGTYATIRKPLIFNDVDDAGLKNVGNRSAAQETGTGRYVFDDETGGNRWTAGNIVEYLTVEATNRLGFTVAMGGQTDVLDLLDGGKLTQEVRSIKSLLDDVVSQGRGVVWRPVVSIDDDDPDNETLVIEVASTFDQAVTTPGGDIFAANPNLIRLDLDTINLTDTPPIITVTQAQADWVVVHGADILSMFSLSYADGTLEPDWNGVDESTFGDADNDDRRTDTYRDVFSRFVVPADWDLTAGGGEGAGTLKTVAPYLGSSGDLISTEIAEETKPWGMRLARQLPVQTAGGEYLPPFAVVKDAAGIWYYLDQLEDGGGHLSMLDNAVGVRVDCNPPELLALNNTAGWSGQTSGARFDYSDMIVTVAMRLDHALEVRHRTPASTTSGPEPSGRIKYIRVPDAEFWYRVPNTITGVFDGSLNYAASAGDEVLRSDASRLRKIASLAVSWYGRTRATLELTQKRIGLLAPPGSMITSVTSSMLEQTIGTIVTSRVWDAEEQTTTIRTGYVELEFARL